MPERHTARTTWEADAFSDTAGAKTDGLWKDARDQRDSYKEKIIREQQEEQRKKKNSPLLFQINIDDIHVNKWNRYYVNVDVLNLRVKLVLWKGYQPIDSEEK